MAETFTDETLMAYADGALDATAARRVSDAARSDEDIAARIALFRGTAEALGRAAEAERAEPAPEALIARVRATLDTAQRQTAGDVVPLRPRPPRGERPAAIWPAALAASLALAVGLGAGWGLAPSGGTGEPPAFDGAWPAQADLSDPLSRLGTGEEASTEAGEITVISSFRDASGAFCREFEIAAEGRGYVSVACRDAGDWHLRFAAATGSDADGYAPASSLEALDAYLEGIGAGGPLDPAAEAEALSDPGG